MIKSICYIYLLDKWGSTWAQPRHSFSILSRTWIIKEQRSNKQRNVTISYFSVKTTTAAAKTESTTALTQQQQKQQRRHFILNLLQKGNSNTNISDSKKWEFLTRGRQIWATKYSFCSNSVWPDLAKFCYFGKFEKVFGNFKRVL